MASNYWAGFTKQRIKRRRLFGIAGTMGAGLAVIAAVGCSSDDDGSSTRNPEVYEPIDTTNRAVKGGTYTTAASLNSVISLDPAGSAGLQEAIHGYSRLVKMKAYKYPERVRPEVDPDAATEWEVSNDGLQYTFKIRPNMRWDPRPPTSGRNMTAQDVVFAWEFYVRLSPFANALANSVDKTAPVLSVQATDPQTVVMRLAFPYAPLLPLLPKNVQIYPPEADGGYDRRTQIRGSSTWRLASFDRDRGIFYEKNPDWYDADKVNFDRIERLDFPEYATGLAQFRAGNITEFAVRQQDVVATKRDMPRLLMKAQEEFPTNPDPIRFGYLPGSPFLDERVRRALSMALDRDLVIESMFETANFTDAGFDVPTRWHSHIANGFEGLWLDPQDRRAFGDSSKYFHFDPNEAAALLRAAGHNPPLTTTLSYRVAPPQVLPPYLKAAWEETGLFRMNVNTQDFTTIIRPQYALGRNNFEGIFTTGASGYADPDGFFSTFVSDTSDRAGHRLPNGQPDMELQRMLERQRVELNNQRRVELIQEIQRYLANKMYFMNEPGSALGYDLAQPWLSNWGVHRSFAGNPEIETRIFQWIDESKRA